jgi:hypothetical protein
MAGHSAATSQGRAVYRVEGAGDKARVTRKIMTKSLAFQKSAFHERLLNYVKERAAKLLKESGCYDVDVIIAENRAVAWFRYDDSQYYLRFVPVEPVPQRSGRARLSAKLYRRTEGIHDPDLSPSDPWQGTVAQLISQVLPATSSAAEQRELLGAS